MAKYGYAIRVYGSNTFLGKAVVTRTEKKGVKREWAYTHASLHEGAFVRLEEDLSLLCQRPVATFETKEEAHELAPALLWNGQRYEVIPASRCVKYEALVACNLRNGDTILGTSRISFVTHALPR